MCVYVCVCVCDRMCAKVSSKNIFNCVFSLYLSKEKCQKLSYTRVDE